MADISYIGATIACVVAKPATTDLSGFAALTWTAVIGEITEWGELGDSSADISIPKLSGRNTHVNGALDGGSVDCMFAFENADAGQVILRAQSNSANDVSFRVTDPDGRIEYFFGRVANVRDKKRTNNDWKGMSAQIRINSPVIRN